MWTSHPAPPTPMKHCPLSLKHNVPITEQAGSLQPLSDLCPDTEQPLGKYTADGLALCPV